MRLLAAFLMACTCFAQAPMARSLELQRASIQKQQARLEESAGLRKQRESVLRQTTKALQTQEGFYTIPWPDPPKLPEVQTSLAMPCPALEARDLFSYTGRASQQTGVAQEILQAVIRQESAGRPCAVSPKGALGLMQLMPATAAGLGVADAFDPQENILAGSRFLQGLLDRYSGDLPLALAAYNAGPGRVDRAGKIPEIPETQRYVRAILDQLGGPAAPGKD